MAGVGPVTLNDVLHVISDLLLEVGIPPIEDENEAQSAVVRRSLEDLEAFLDLQQGRPRVPSFYALEAGPRGGPSRGACVRERRWAGRHWQREKGKCKGMTRKTEEQ
jgi:hypothetical protein